jgi:predicted methyltransferase
LFNYTAQPLVDPATTVEGAMKLTICMKVIATAALGCLIAAGAAGAKQGPEANAVISAAVDAPDRPEADRKLDAARKPKEMLAFFGVKPGMKLLDLFTVRGWYAELEARVAGPKGEVYAQNPPEYLQKFGDKDITERLAGNRLPTVKRWDRPMDALELPAKHFDGAIANDVFHDFFWLSKDVDGVVKQVYDALKPGGFFAIVDHSAPAGTGDAYAKSRDGQHRIDEALVKQMLAKAGFKLEAESDLLRNPDDDRTKPFFAPEMKGKNTDKFALLFRKPN